MRELPTIEPGVPALRSTPHPLYSQMLTVYSRIAWRLRILFGEPIPAGELARFFERLAIMLRAGMEIPGGIRATARSAEPELKSIMESAAIAVSRGGPLHEALAPFANRLPPVVLPVLEVGEMSGTLEAAAVRLADAFGKSDGVEQRFRFSVINPKMVVLFLALDFMAFGFAAAFLPSMLDLCILLAKAALLFFAVRYVVRLAMRSERLRLGADTVKLAIPVGGPVARKLSAARWGRSFATMWEAGVPIAQALEVSSHSALNAYYEREIKRVALRTRDGCLLSDALSGTSMLPVYLLDVLRTGESTGRFAEGLESFVGILEDEAMQTATSEYIAAVATINLFIGLAIAGAIRLF